MRMRRVVGSVILLMVLASCLGCMQVGSPLNWTDVHDLKAQLAPATLDAGLQYVPGAGIRLSGSAQSGTASFAEADAPFSANNVVLSWNFDMPSNSGAMIEIRATNANTSTAWYEMARIGTTTLKNARIKSDSYGYIADDTLMLYGGWPRIEYRVTLYRKQKSATPTLRLMSICYADTNFRVPYLSPPDPGVTKSLPVPWRTQNNVPKIWNQICGPTSMSMAEQYLGVNLPTETVAVECYDSYNGIYGNWPFIAQGAAGRGLKAHMFRCNDQLPIRQEIDAGRPVILGVQWGPGELTNAPIESTDGHLILCVGYTATGDYIINDPAGSDSRWDHVIYDKNQMVHCWLWHGDGLAIVVGPQ